MGKPNSQNSDLDAPCWHEEVEHDTSPAVVLSESHQKPETDENHNIDILEHRVVILDAWDMDICWIDIHSEFGCEAIADKDNDLAKKE